MIANLNYIQQGQILNITGEMEFIKCSLNLADKRGQCVINVWPLAVFLKIKSTSCIILHIARGLKSEN